MNRLYLAGTCSLLCALALYSLLLGVHEMTLVGLFSGKARQMPILPVIPVLCLVAIITAGMSVVGLIMQQLARNKFERQNHHRNTKITKYVSVTFVTFVFLW